MATIQKRGDKYRAIVRKRGYTQTATFTRKRDAEHWAREVEIAIENGTLEVYESLSFGDILRRYLAEVTPSKKSAAKEILRLNSFMRNFSRISDKPIEHLNRRDVALWRDARLRTVAPGSVNREWNTLSAAYTHAVKVWGLSLPENPFRQVARPKSSPPREQRITPDEVQAFLEAFRYDGQRRPQQPREHVAWCFLFAIETAMRAGEILKLQPDDIGERTATLRNTKNGTDRTVPLSREARRLLALVDLPLPISSASLDALFRKYRPAALRHIHFHDTRHEALSRMAKKIHNPMDLAKISGHKDVNILMNVYYNPDDSHLADLLD
ncbi:MAG: site-specific integrase [Cardiobacteriaceae bacterium]|nr:site-specific integrase [Cardiobacteriaceae bacterium]